MAEQVEVTGPLLTQHTSPTVIKKTFTRLGKLLDILKADMGKPLPPKTKFEKLDADVSLRSNGKTSDYMCCRYMLIYLLCLYSL